MGSKLRKTKPTSIDDIDVPLLISLINDFTNATVLIEREVSRHGLDQLKPNHVLNWMSLKVVSHFNLGTALELMLKLLLLRESKDYKHIHGLTGLYLVLPKKVKESLSATYRDSLQGSKYVLVAVKEKSPEQPRLKNRPLSTIRDMLEYFDKDMKLDQKRYSWEPAQRRQWRHFINDPTAFVTFIRRVLEEVNANVPRESGGNHGGTGTGEGEQGGTRGREREQGTPQRQPRSQGALGI